MSRIPKDRPGYTGYACTGIAYTVLDPVDCLVNKYELLPPLAMCTVSEAPWLDMGLVYADARLAAMAAACDMDYDPFLDTFVDLRLALLDNGFGSLLTEDCYGPAGRYPEGYMPITPLVLGCVC